jgi:hypothetical protein
MWSSIKFWIGSYCLLTSRLALAENTSGATRYRLLETVRQYALEKLSESGEAADVRNRHRDHYTALAASLDTPGRVDYERRLEQAEIEIDNLRAAFGWSREDADTEQALQLVSALQPLWLARGRIQEGLSWFNAVRAHETTPDHEVTAPVRARAIADKAVLDSWVGVYNMAGAEEVLTLARELDDSALVARALFACSSAAVFNAEMAQPYFTEAIGLARTLGDRWMLAQILSRQAHIAFLAGDAIAVCATAEEGRQLADAIGDRFESRQCRWRLAGAHFMQADLVGAIAEFRELVAEAEADHDEMLRVTIQSILPHVLAYHGDTNGARAAADAAIEAAADVGDLYVGSAYLALIVAALAAGDAALAADAAEAASSRLSGYREIAAIDTPYLAQVALVHGDRTAARRLVEYANHRRNERLVVGVCADHPGPCCDRPGGVERG